MMPPGLGAVVQLVVVVAAASAIGDLVHGGIHLLSRLHAPPFSWIAALHDAHHRFLDRDLHFHDERFARNLVLHQIPECATRMAAIIGATEACGASAGVRGAALALCAVDFFVVVAQRGRDSFHRARPPIRAWRSRVFVDAQYHALHHVFPEHFWAAHWQLVDVLLGRMLPLRGRRVVVTGASRFVGDLAALLRREGADVQRVDEDDVSDDVLAAADVVVLGHGADARDRRSYEALIARARAGARSLPLDVWAVGDDPAWRARADLVVDDEVLLRRLVRAPALGPALTLALLRRGMRLV